MAAVPAQLIREIRKHLKAECALYDRYNALLEEQRKWTTRFSAEKIEKITEKRDDLTRQMQQAHAQRLIFLQQFPEDASQKLSEQIEKHIEGAEKKELLQLTEELRQRVLESRRLSVEENQVSHFALGMVNSGISLIWQATQSVTKSYTKSGNIEEAYTPTSSRNERTLKEA